MLLDLRSRSVLVVGAGPIAARKIAGLLDVGATVTVVAPEVVDEIEQLGQAGRLRIFQRAYERGDLVGQRLVVVSTNDTSVQQAVFDDAEAAGIWCNAADDPSRCSYMLPAVHREGPVIIAVSSQGRSPALASWLRTFLAERLPNGLAEVAADLAQQRDAIRASGESTEKVDWAPRIRAAVARFADVRDSVGARDTPQTSGR